MLRRPEFPPLASIRLGVVEIHRTAAPLAVLLQDGQRLADLLAEGRIAAERRDSILSTPSREFPNVREFVDCR